MSTPEERLEALRHAMQGAEVTVVLFGWMREVEEQLISLRKSLNETARTADRAFSGEVRLYG